MVAVFESVVAEVRAELGSSQQELADLDILKRLDRRARIVLGLFSRKDEITSNDVTLALGISKRQVRNLLAEWSAGGWLIVSDTARKSRRYRLSAEYRQFIGKITAI